jgi:ABC-type transport system involved in cytochrome c biogenesis permease subunit
VLLAAGPRVQAQVQSLGTFEHIPALEDGRVMPLDTVARSKLLAYSGRSTFERAPASHWLAGVLFAPDTARNDKIFLVNNPEVIEALGLPPATGRERYSYAELAPTLSTLLPLVRAAWNLDSNARSPVEQELLRLYHSLTEYGALAEALSFTAPHPAFTVTDPALKTDLGLPADSDVFSFVQIMECNEQLQVLWERQGTVPQNEWTPYQQKVFELVDALSARGREGARQAGALAIMPVPTHGDQTWVSPWHVVSMGTLPGPLQELVSALQDMATSFRAGQQVAFDLAARTFLTRAIEQASDPDSVEHLGLEIRYNKAQAFYRAELLYGLSFLLMLVSVMLPGRRVFYRAGAVAAGAALVFHTLGILARMAIMGRPPVTNLYSTFVFVGWCAVLLGLALEYLQRNRLGLLTASVSGLALLLTSGRFATDGDTMGVMVAVLDSNFWLATHVVTITVGYAGCCVAGLLGHVYLVQAIRRKPDDPGLRETYDALYGALAFGLIFSFLGTMLGGVWADQSWGRFWGWDPKENGALVIVLWSALIFHAKVGRLIGPAGFAAGCVLGVIWVLLAWLGVNLLGVGLHSYGFTSGIARGLLIACTAEAVFVALTLPFTKGSAPGETTGGGSRPAAVRAAR